MTFEEFFTKKKIDLEQLKQAEPNLFSEFKWHFELMGEKSFDYTKKFWFNKLRQIYHLIEVPKPGKEVIVTEQASQVELLSSLTIDQMPFEKPIPNAKEFSEEAKIQADGINTSTRLKFKPRNIITKPQETPEGEDTAEQTTKDEAKKAVGFKPIFKPKAAEETENSEKAEALNEQIESSPETSSEPEKPAYKPKFNLKNIPKKAEPESVEDNELVEEIRESDQTTEDKPAYKPKLN